MIRPFAWLLVLCVGLFSCSTDEEPAETPASATTPRLVGKVASVHQDDGFVLIEMFGDVVLGRELLLTTSGEGGRTASLTVSGERLGRYAAADIKSGGVLAGDAVYARPKAEEAPDFTPDPTIPSFPETVNP